MSEWEGEMLKFRPRSRVFPDQRMWFAVSGQHTFIITHDPDGYSASVKVAGAKRYDLGGYAAHSTLGAAVQACNRAEETMIDEGKWQK